MSYRMRTHVVEQLEQRVLLAAAVPGVTLDPVLVPKFAVEAPNALDPGFFYQPTSQVIDPATGATVQTYDIGMYAVDQDAGLGLRDASGDPILTRFFGYGPAAEGTGTYPGRTLHVTRDNPIHVNWTNALPDEHLLPIDPTLLDPMQHYDPASNTFIYGLPAVPHLHGGHTESASDGLPLQWFTPGDTMTGADFVKSNYTYANDQDAATLWYHDHAMGVTRLSAYAGLAGFYIIRDARDTGLVDNPIGLPAGSQEIGLAIQDKMFTVDGQLYFPTAPVVDPGSGEVITETGILPEMFGDVMLVNGKAWPYMDLQAKRYRLRLLNGNDSRFLTINLAFAAGKDLNAAGRTIPMYQIGTDQGLLNAPVPLTQLTIAPGERADVIVDLTGLKPGQRLIMFNTAKTPFPKGAPVSTGTTDRIMMFNIVGRDANPDVSLPVSQLQLRPSDPIAPASVPEGAKVRKLALFEMMDEYGRMEPMLGTAEDITLTGIDAEGNEATVTVPAGFQHFMGQITENPALGATEVWEIYNNTPDAHPIHLHLVKFQVVNRQRFSAQVDESTGAMSKVKLQGPAIAPTGGDAGWKDTVIMLPGEVTRIVATFDLPGKYVWHCHILSHEEHDMMRHFWVGDGVPIGGSDDDMMMSAPPSTAEALGAASKALGATARTGGSAGGALLASVAGRSSTVFFAGTPVAASTPGDPLDEELLASRLSDLLKAD